jgi:hypothetical protein
MSSANPANFTRTIKLRSVVDAEYKTSYNRLSFMIDPDDFSSDLSQSYLALRMYLCHADGVKLTKGEFTALDLQNKYISFGQGDQTYSPACLVKTARLFAQANYGTPLEEVNWCNTLTQSLYQLASDFESVASSSLTANNAVVFGHPESQGAMFANLLSDTIGAGEQVPIEVHIYLSDLFGIFKSKNFYLNDPAIMGLRVDLELEDLKPLFRSQIVNQQVACPTPLLAVGDTTNGGLVPSLAVNPITSLTGQNNTGQMTCVGGANGNPIIPDNTSGGLIAKQSNVIQPYQYVQPFFPTYNTPQDTLSLNALWSTPALAAFGLAVNAAVRLNFTLTPIAGLATLRQQEQFTRLDTIKTIATVSGKTAITFNNTYTPITAGGQWQTELTSVEVVDSVQTSLVGTADYQALWATNSMLLPAGNIAALQTVGLIGDITGLTAGQAVPVGNSKFNLHCQTLLIDASGPTAVPVEVWQDTWIAPDVPTSRQLVSNRSIAMPIQGATAQLLSARMASNATDVILVFKKLGMVNDNSLAPAALYSTSPTTILPTPVFDGQLIGGVMGHTAEVFYEFWVSDYNAIATGLAVPDEAWTYLIDKSELVLVQSAKQPGIPMNRVYSTSRVEVTTIQSAVPIYNYQFVVPEENVYNIMLMTPQYNVGLDAGGNVVQPQSLISWQRGVTQYRYSINQVDQCNRNIEVGTNTSFYPSSLYLESLIDVLGNGNKGVMSLAGPLTVPHSNTPVVTFPLRIYKSFDGQNYIFHPQGFVAQITLYADTAHDGYIVPGNVYFWKQMLRTF